MSALLAWARAFDKKVDAVEAERLRHESMYRRVLREERSRLGDVDAERLRRWLFTRWMRRG